MQVVMLLLGTITVPPIAGSLFAKCVNLACRIIAHKMVKVGSASLLNRIPIDPPLDAGVVVGQRVWRGGQCEKERRYEAEDSEHSFHSSVGFVAGVH